MILVTRHYCTATKQSLKPTIKPQKNSTFFSTWTTAGFFFRVYAIKEDFEKELPLATK
jgi:hypothetical protein